MTKRCGKCKIIQPLSNFTKDRNAKDELTHTCKSCHNKHYTDNKSIISLNMKEWRNKNKEKIKLYRAGRKKIYAAALKQKNIKTKLQIYSFYGNKCNCCGETEIKFLSLDHINNDGAKHRKENPGARTGGLQIGRAHV